MMNSEVYMHQRGGCRTWYQNGLMHRESGPAVEYNSGTRMWYHQGLRHCATGPAIIWSTGQHTWYWQGLRTSFDTWCGLAEVDSETKLVLAIKYPPLHSDSEFIADELG